MIINLPHDFYSLHSVAMAQAIDQMIFISYEGVMDSRDVIRVTLLKSRESTGGSSEFRYDPTRSFELIDLSEALGVAQKSEDWVSLPAARTGQL